MALDHYVPQVHLKNFCSPELGGQQMYATRKSNLQSFPCHPRSVCRIEEGNTNGYLIHDRAIEDFLRGVEPKYNAALAKLRDNDIDQESIYVIAGFVAYVGSCSPAAMRIHAGTLQSTVETTAILLDRSGKIPKAPPSLGSKSLSELLADQTVRVGIDPKYPQALGINTLIGRLSIYGNSPWEILTNPNEDCPFFTSDYPIALEATGAQTMNWIVPLAPDRAIRIIPDIALSGVAPDLSFKKFRARARLLTRTEGVTINRLLVRCAEDLVFYRDRHTWIGTFIEKNRRYRVETVTDRIPYETGFMSISTQRIVS